LTVWRASPATTATPGDKLDGTRTQKIIFEIAARFIRAVLRLETAVSIHLIFIRYFGTVE